MTKEEKKLLLTDLCSRLPYGVVIDYPNCFGGHYDEVMSIDRGMAEETVTTLYNGVVNSIENVKPYLRPMSSMTEEEIAEFESQTEHLLSAECIELPYATVVDWLNEHHFDYRGLISKGLALEAPKGIY